MEYVKVVYRTKRFIFIDGEKGGIYAVVTVAAARDVSVFLDVDTAVLVAIKQREHRAQTGYRLGPVGG
jgi:hypothetical protein